MKRALIKSVFYDDPEVLRMLEVKDREELLAKINEKPQSEIALILKGDTGEKGDEPSNERLIDLIKPLIPEPIKGETGESGKDGKPGKSIVGPQRNHGRDGKDASPIHTTKIVRENLNINDELVKSIINVMKKLPLKDRLEIQDIRNASSFMYKGTRYKIEELMHGGGGTSSPGKTLTLEIPTGIVDDSNTTFTVLNQPLYIVVNGGQYSVGNGIYASYSGGTITLAAPVGATGFIESFYNA